MYRHDMPKQETCKRVLKVQNNLTACRGNQPILKLMKHSNAMFGGCAFTRKLERRQSIASREASRTYLTCHLYSNHHYHSGTSLVTRNRRICNLYNSCASHAFGYRRTLGLVRHPLLQASVRTIWSCRLQCVPYAYMGTSIYLTNRSFKHFRDCAEVPTPVYRSIYCYCYVAV